MMVKINLNPKSPSRLRAVLAAMSLGAVAIGCGSSTSSTAPIFSPPISGSTIPLNGTITYATCTQEGGFSGTTPSGVQYCEADEGYGLGSTYYGSSGYSAFPSLVAGSPVLSDIPTGLYVHQNDTVIIKAQGGWGLTSCSVSSWGPFSFNNCSASCDNVNLDGTPNASNVTISGSTNGMPPGLVASDGVGVQFLGHSGDVVWQSAGGPLVLGFNVAVTYSGGSVPACAQVEISELEVRHCMDVNNNVIVCPGTGVVNHANRHGTR